MSVYANYVAMTLSGTPGTGTATLNAALASPDRSFLAAYGAVSTTVDVEWYSDANTTVRLGVERNCVYNGGSPGTLTRGTPETPNSLVSIPAGASVRVALPASAANRYEAAALEHVAGTDTAMTLAVNTLTVVDLASTLTANRTYTFPATAAVGDRVGVLVSVGSTARRLSITAASGDTLAGVAGGTVWGELFETGDLTIWRCTVANTTWVLESYKFGPAETRVQSTTTQSCTGGATTTITTALNDVISNPGGWWDTTNKRFLPKRPGRYAVFASSQLDSSSRHVTNAVRSSGGAIYSSYGGSAATFNISVASGTLVLNGATEHIQMTIYSDNTSNTTNSGMLLSFVYLGP